MSALKDTHTHTLKKISPLGTSNCTSLYFLLTYHRLPLKFYLFTSPFSIWFLTFQRASGSEILHFLQIQVGLLSWSTPSDTSTVSSRLKRECSPYCVAVFPAPLFSYMFRWSGVSCIWLSKIWLTDLLLSKSPELRVNLHSLWDKCHRDDQGCIHSRHSLYFSLMI